MAKQIEVGDKVKIKKSSEFYGKNLSNPAGVAGVVETVGSRLGLTIIVKWPGDIINSYNAHDLKLAKEPKEDLLTEVLYTDSCDDVLEVDTSMRAQVYIGAGELDMEGIFNSDKTIELSPKDVKKLRKQLKAWLDKNHPTV